MATATRMTPEELMQLPDDGRIYELVNGELREKNMSQESGHVGGEIRRILSNYAYPRQLGVVYPNDVGFRCFESDPDLVKKPDVAFIQKSRLTRKQYASKGFCPVVPDLVVEVVSPRDMNWDIHEKRTEWLEAGVPCIWIVDPGDESLRVYFGDQPPQLYTVTDTITLESLLPGFSCSVAEFFKPPALAD